MHQDSTEIAGLIIRSTDSVFLSMVGVHLLFGLAAASTGAIAMLAPKQHGRHTRFGTIYFWSILGLFVSASLLTLLRGPEDAHLALLGGGAFTSALIGRAARRGYLGNSVQIHLVAMGSSYVLMLTAFYVETGHQLPLWNRLPPILYWIIPSAVGVPLIARAFIHRRVQRSRS